MESDISYADFVDWNLVDWSLSNPEVASKYGVPEATADYYREVLDMLCVGMSWWDNYYLLKEEVNRELREEVCSSNLLLLNSLG